MIKINGDSGILCAKKLIKPLVSHVISPEVLSLFTWTGKTQQKGVRKLVLKEYTETNSLLYEVLLAADKTYTQREFFDNMVIKVIKGAYLNAEIPNNKENGSNCSTGNSHQYGSDAAKRTSDNSYHSGVNNSYDTYSHQYSHQYPHQYNDYY